MKKIFDEQTIRNDYKQLTQTLIEKKLSITTMESATSGQIASLITDTEGASSIFKGAFITYSNEAKCLHGVPKDIIETFSVYSKETACAMAEACQKVYNTNIAIGITGTMGNIDPENETHSIPGQVYFAIYFCGKMYAYYKELPLQPTRLAYKLAVAKEVLDELKKLLCSYE